MENWYAETGPDEDVVISSRIRLARNFKDIAFPARANKKQQDQVISIIKEALPEMNCYLMSDLPNLEKEYLIETHTISSDLAKSKKNSCLFTNDERASVMVNEEDHMRIQSVFSGLRLEEAYDDCLKIERNNKLQENYAFTYEFGYLTACPTTTGTGLRASAMVHVPALVISGKINSILDSCSKLGIAVRGIYGENSGSGAHMIQISNQVTLGQSEAEIIASIKNIIGQIAVLERQERQNLLEKGGIHFTDKIYRALGILKNTRCIDTEEALKLISEVKMGLDMGILKGATISDIVTILTNVQPACLQKIEGRILTPDERDEARATFIRENIAKVE